MIKRLFILFLLTSCYSVDRDCENFKMGEFEFTYKLNDTIQRSLFTRTLDYEIEEFNSVIDSSSISWVNDCEFVLTKLNPKTNFGFEVGKIEANVFIFASEYAPSLG